MNFFAVNVRFFSSILVASFFLSIFALFFDGWRCARPILLEFIISCCTWKMFIHEFDVLTNYRGHRPNFRRTTTSHPSLMLYSLGSSVPSDKSWCGFAIAVVSTRAAPTARSSHEIRKFFLFMCNKCRIKIDFELDECRFRDWKAYVPVSGSGWRLWPGGAGEEHFLHFISRRRPGRPCGNATHIK